MTKKAIKYSLTLVLIPFQLARIHKGISKVVKIIRNNDIPSIPNIKLILKEGNQKMLLTNWNLVTELSNQTHKNKETIKVINEKFNAVRRNNLIFHEGIIKRIEAPIKGKIKRCERIFSGVNIFLFYGIEILLE